MIGAVHIMDIPVPALNSNPEIDLPFISDKMHAPAGGGTKTVTAWTTVSPNTCHGHGGSRGIRSRIRANAYGWAGYSAAGITAG